MARPFAGEVHGAQRVLEARMLRGRENPPCALQLMDPAQPLQPRGIDEVLFRGSTSNPAGAPFGDAKVSVDGVARKVDAGILGAGLLHPPILSVTRLLAEGIELFNSGRYWDAHEAWERAWTPDRKGPDSGFYKGLIQVAAGCLHYTRHNRRGAVNKWRSGADYLRPYLPAHGGVELEPLVLAVDRYLQAMNGGAWPELTMPRIDHE